MNIIYIPKHGSIVDWTWSYSMPYSRLEAMLSIARVLIEKT